MKIMRNHSVTCKTFVTVASAVILATACGGGGGSATSGPPYTIGGMVTGMNPGGQVTLLNNGSNPTEVKSNTSFAFSDMLGKGTSYNVSIKTDPLLQTCTPSKATGSFLSANVSNVDINCVTSKLRVLGSANGEFVTNLLLANDGNFYGGANDGLVDNGFVFKITPDGSFSIIYSFAGGPNDGSFPYGALVQASDGNLYGETVGGGATGNGVIYKLTLSGTETVLYSFAGAPGDGSSPNGLTIGADGNLYGTTLNGGVHPSPNSAFGTSGVFFRMTLAGQETILYSFGATGDGANPYSAMIQGTDGNFYGTTEFGGTDNGGTVFKMTSDGTETILHSFGAAGDAKWPYRTRVLQASDGNFYGSTSSGGTYDYGAIFKISPSGTETVLYSFNKGNEAPYGPGSSLIQGNDGNFYGTSMGGGSYDYGTIYQFSPNGNLVTVYSFTGGIDGSGPVDLILGNNGHFYGRTLDGPGYGPVGIIFKL